MARKLVNKVAATIVCTVIMMSNSVWADDGQYKASVFGLLFGKLLDDGKEHRDVIQKNVPYDYVERLGQDGGDFYNKANLIIIDRYTGKRNEISLQQDKNKAFDNRTLKLLKCWQKSVDGVSHDARALLLLSADSSIGGKSIESSRIWLFSRYPSLSHEDVRYELMLQSCTSGIEADEAKPEAATPE